jgi:hypothetical protein
MSMYTARAEDLGWEADERARGVSKGVTKEAD